MTNKIQKTAAMGAIILFLVAGGTIIFSFSDRTDTTKTVGGASLNASETNSMVAVVGIDDPAIARGVAVGNSWPGEIISPGIGKIQPQREGVITDWRVGIGDVVSAGQVLGTISAPPATPELIGMLANMTEAWTSAKANAKAMDEFAAKEQLRLAALKDSLDGAVASGEDLSFTTLETMRQNVDTQEAALRSFIERAISGHVSMVSSATDWRRPFYLDMGYGATDENLQKMYAVSLFGLINQLKSSADIQIGSAQDYFALAVRLANRSGNDSSFDQFKEMAATDQKEFLDFLGMYREAVAELADKETEYKVMISEKSAMVEKDRSMAHADAEAAEAAYKSVAGEITGELYIRAPRSGIISAIYKKVGDLVVPDMSIATITGRDRSDLLVRMHIPSNIRRPRPGEILSVVRPGFPSGVRRAKMIGVGASLDETGSYMADAVFTDPVDWPAGASVRVISPESSDVPILKLSSIWWGEDGIPYIWGVSDAGRIFAKKLVIGRTLGEFVEVSEGAKNGDRYILNPAPDIRENMLLDDFMKEEGTMSPPASSGGKEHVHMEGMAM